MEQNSQCDYCDKVGQIDCCDMSKLLRLAGCEDKTEFGEFFDLIMPPVTDGALHAWMGLKRPVDEEKTNE